MSSALGKSFVNGFPFVAPAYDVATPIFCVVFFRIVAPRATMSAAIFSPACAGLLHSAPRLPGRGVWRDAGGLCRGREVCRVPGVGAYCIRPTDVPTGTGARHIHSAPRGPSNGAYSIRPYTDAAKPAEDWAKNRFGAQNSPRIAPKTDLKPKTRRELHQKSIWSPKPAEDCTKNAFEAQNSPRIAPKTDLEPQTRRGLRQKRNLSPRRGSFCVKNGI